jgi:hypothetical protein
MTAAAAARAAGPWVMSAATAEAALLGLVSLEFFCWLLVQASEKFPSWAAARAAVAALALAAKRGGHAPPAGTIK